ncbi:DUF3667 domain-containing protein [Pseudoxanthomonas sp. PXM02]|uniref:DUF3667 domain-containing protein n=1 Tax=Pseudoxanthomonas sp. PXM02 TaxID=2769294 RepID=UPI001781348E|nr:DUF3667 domain-containing protein [Pseudoxanthomonas sp. PXM02]MBD9478647.1 DUF3667 domain-containing protein [Pseudoxanthomonas sp. PXM02]
MSDVGKCANCARVIDGPEQKFCPACGQATPAHRIDWHFLGHELEHSVLHMDRGVLYSLKELMLRPGHLMRAYLDGQRAKQVKPLLLIMMSAAAVVLLSKYLGGGDVLGGMEATTNHAADLSGPLATVSRSIGDWMNAYFAMATLMLLPFEAAAFRLAFYRVGALNYPEWLVITAFLTVQTFVFWSIALLLQRWVPGASAWSVLVSSAYGVFSLMQLFRPYPRWKSLLRGVLGYGIFLVLSQVVLATFVLAAMAVAVKG